MTAEMVWTGADELRPLLVPLDTVVLHPRNPRRGRVHLIAESLERFGQVRAILVNQATGEIVAGNHTARAARDVGWTHIAAVQQAFATEDDARDYLLADNRLPELGDYDHDQLIALLGEVEAADAWVGTGYTSDVLEDLRALHDQIPEVPREPFPGGHALSPDDLAARAAQLAAGRTFDEVVLVFDDDGVAQFDSDVGILAREYSGEGGVTEVVCRAVAGEALRLNQA